MTLPSQFRIGEFVVTPAKDTLRGPAGEVSVQPQVMQLLLCLAEANGNVVDNNELLDRLFGAGAGAPQNLDALVARLRKAFGDTANNARYIGVVPRKGKFLIQQVECVEEEPDHKPTPPQKLIALLLAGLAVLAGLWVLFRDTPAPPPPRVAVLAFEMEDAQQPVLGGLAESLQQAVADMPGLLVKAWSSSSLLPSISVMAPEQICEQLGVDYLVTGKTTRSQGVPVLQMVFTDRDGFERGSWEVRLEKAQFADDFLIIADKLLADVATMLKLNGFRPGMFEEAHRKKFGAWPEYLRGLQQLRLRTPASLQAAIAHFGEAIRIDENYALARAGIAIAYHLQADYDTRASLNAASLMQPHVEAALALDPDLAEAEAARGAMLRRQGELDKAMASYRRAITLKPNLVMPRIWLGVLLQDLGEVGEAREQFQHAAALDPRNVTVKSNLAEVNFSLGKSDKGFALLEEALQIQPDTPFLFSNLAYWSRKFGQLNDSVEWARRGQQNFPADAASMIVLAQSLFHAGQVEQSKTWLMRARVAAPNNDWIVISSADLYFLMGLDEELDKLTARAASKNQGAISYTQRKLSAWRGVYFYANGDYSLAADWFDKATLTRQGELSLPDYVFFLTTAALMKRALGESSAASTLLNQAEIALSAARRKGWNTPEIRMRDAAVASVRGEPNTAVKLLEKAVSEGFAETAWLDRDPAFSALHGLAQFEALR